MSLARLCIFRCVATGVCSRQIRVTTILEFKMSPTGLVIKLGHKLEEATIQEKRVAG